MQTLATNQIAFARFKEVRADRLTRQIHLAAEAYCKNVPAVERARQAGAADRYYSRKFNPRVKTGQGPGDRAAYSPSEIAAYRYGFDNETDRKEW